MIVGHGDLASVLPDREDLIFFASGVSNSQETREEEFERERKLLGEQGYGGRIVYFSSLCVFYSDTPYAKHKREMELFLKKYHLKWTIIRLGNITWGKNPHTLLNFFREKIKNNLPFEIRNEYRYIVDKDEFLHWIKLIPAWNCEMNIPGKRMHVSDIVTMVTNELAYPNANLSYGHA